MPDRKGYDTPDGHLTFEQLVEAGPQAMVLWLRQMVLPVRVDIVDAYISAYDRQRVLLWCPFDDQIRNIGTERLFADSDETWRALARHLYDQGLCTHMLERLLYELAEVEAKP